MTVYKQTRGKSYIFDFWFKGQRHRGNTGQLRLEDARAWERQHRIALARRQGGLPVETAATPRFQDWAQVYLSYLRDVKQRKETYLDQVVRYLRLVLAFWGAPPTKSTPVAGGPYHDLRLGDPLETPDWLLKFEAWLTSRHVQGSHRNHFLDALNGMYRVALLPHYRAHAGVSSNPFLALPRQRVKRRPLTLTPPQLRAWMAAAAPHVRLALAIGSLAPKLRLANILALRWDTHLDAKLQWITVTEHKTDAKTPVLAVPVVPALRALLAAEKATKASRYVIHWRGKPVGSIKKALERAAERAGVSYGLADGGATFHTLRHHAATLLAELDVTGPQLQATMGHREARTTAIYTHLRPTHERQVLAKLARKLQLDRTGESTGTLIGADEKRQRNRPESV